MVTGGGDNSSVGAVWAFTRSDTKWSAQGSKLVPTGEVGKARQGLVALSASDNEALVDGPYDDKDEGAVWYYIRSGSTWSQTGSKITASGEEEEGFFGSPLAMASNGAVALIGGAEDNTGPRTTKTMVQRGSLRAPTAKGMGFAGRKGNRTGSTTAIAQMTGRPLEPEQTIYIHGPINQHVVLFVRARSDGHFSEVSFANLEIGRGQTRAIRVTDRHGRPVIRPIGPHGQIQRPVEGRG